MKKILFLITLIAFISISVMAGDKTNYRNALVFAYSPANNVYEDDNIKLEIYDGQLWAINKTNRTIFIDLSQCFAVHNGMSYPMFEERKGESKDDKKASKKKVSTSIDQYISIAPATGTKQNETFICNLAAGLYGEYTTTESPSGSFSEYEEKLITLLNEMLSESQQADPKGKKYVGSVHRHLTEDESINNIGANIAYAFNKRAEDWTPVGLSTWVSDVYFAPYYVEMPKDIDKKSQRGFDVKKTESAKIHIKADSPFEFDSDRSPVIVADWMGEFKKGKFSLNPTFISKKKGMGFGKALLGSLATVATGGAAAFLLVNNNDNTFYKRSIVFNGANDVWPGMTYMDNTDLSKFDNKSH